MTYEDILPVIVTLDDAIKHKSYLDAPIIGHTVGEVEKSMKEDDHILESEARMGGQEHFYFETNAILCSPIGNDGLPSDVNGLKIKIMAEKWTLLSHAKILIWLKSKLPMS